MICVVCGRDLNAIGQDNVSYIPGQPLCEDCGLDCSYEEDCFEEEESCHSCGMNRQAACDDALQGMYMLSNSAMY